VAGNHDHAALTIADVSFFNRVAKEAVIWTQEALTKENTDWLHSLPMMNVNEEYDLLLVHASPYNPEEWNYVLTMGDARRAFDHFDQRFCFIGHSHQPFIIEMYDENMNCVIQQQSVNIRDEARYLVNVGSVGQPRDRVPSSTYCLLDLEEGKIEVCRTEYDIEAAQKAILDVGLPRELSERLTYGW
jgi:diadenosine tetraphosphatase ApaH/serine/threonine PP2A family protein phosphatase